MPHTRVLIVDDSVVVRRLVSDVLSSDPEIEVAGTAPNGRIALAKLPDLTPDVVVLDVEMPVMGGLETLRAIRQADADLPVIMFSSLTEQGAETTLDALAQGASDYAAKPASTRGLEETKAQVRERLVAKVKALGASRVGRATSVKGPSSPARRGGVTPSKTQRRSARAKTRRIDIVAIGVSTGGPNALTKLVPTFPADFPVPVVIVQHMPPVFTKSLAQRLNGQSALDVCEGAKGDVLRPGGAWIAPGGLHMEVQRARGAVRVQTHEGPPENNCRPAVDVLFRSVHAAYGPRVLAVVLTGMGRDGLRGVQPIAAAGGQVVVQDEASSVVWGMPGAVAQAGLADRVLPLSSVGREIVRRVQRAQAPPATA